MPKNLGNTFFIFGMWCPGCAKNLEEHLKAKIPGFEFRINYTQSLVSSNFSDFKKLKNIVSGLGFRASPLKSLSQVKIWQTSELKKLTIYLVLACWSFMWGLGVNYLFNSELNNIKLYLNISIMAFIAIPLMHSLKIGFLSLWARRPGIDSFIALSFWSLVIHTFVQIREKSSDFIFDSFFMLFMLFTVIRFLEFFFTRKKIRRESIEEKIENTTYTVKKNNKMFEKSISALSKGANIILKENQFVPFDANVIRGTGTFIEESFSGIMSLKNFKTKSFVPAGSRLVTGFAELEIVNEKSFLSLNQPNRAQYASKTDILFSYMKDIFLFVIGFSLLVSIFEFLRSGDINKAMEYFAITLTLLNLCYVYLIPIVRDKILNKRYNLKLHSSDFFQKLVELENVIVDKSGTLIREQYQIALKENMTNLLDSEIWSIVYGLELSLSHPLARSFVSTCSLNKIRPLKLDEHYYDGSVVSGISNDGVKWELGERDEKGLILLKSARGICRFEVSSAQERNLIYDLIHQVRDKKVYLLTGDPSRIDIDIPGNSLVYKGLSPSDKKDFIEKLSGKSLYIGDGLNDILAAEAADLFISFEDSFDSVVFRADAFMQRDTHLDKSIFKAAELFDQKLKVFFIILFFVYITSIYTVINGVFKPFYLLIVPILILMVGNFVLNHKFIK